MRIGLLATAFLFLTIPCLMAQYTIDVFESTLKVSALSEEVFYYGFAEGDQLVFSLQEIDGKELKELEIIELPSSSRFMDFKTTKVDSKMLIAAKTAIYKFRLANSSLAKRVCKVKIQRIPVGEATRNFNTSVYWRTKTDSTVIPIQESYLLKSDTVATMIVDQKAKVSSQNAANGNRPHSLVDFELPAYTISWSYYIGVGKEGHEVFEKAQEKFVNDAAKTIGAIPGYGPLAALALEGVNLFTKMQGGDNVKYWFISDWDNVEHFDAGQRFMQYKQGDVEMDASQMRSPLAGKVYLKLWNDNAMQAIEVVVKVTVVQVHQTFGTRTVNKVSVTSHQEPYLKD
jgi:hypothetical protein